MKTLSCLIVDDEPLAREGIADYCVATSFLSVASTCKNALQAEAFLKENPVDLLFLDIQMPRISGIEWLKSQAQTPLTIMTTAYSEYALESFNYNVVDYLVKPISFERFTQAAEKAKRLLPSINTVPYLFIKDTKGTHRICVDHILFIEAQQNYVKIVTTDANYITHSTLKTMKQSLPESSFIQTHKSFLVALDKIEKIIAHQIHISTHQLPLSTRLKKEVLERVSVLKK